MKVFFDTTVLVAALVESHPRHARSFGSLAKAKGDEYEWAVSAHSLAELYAVLTTLPVKPRISPGTAWRLIDENFQSASVIPFTNADYTLTIQRLARAGLLGGIVYDALLARAAEKWGADRLLTLNLDDFRRASPASALKIEEP